MKLAIHKSLGSFSERWINYCDENDISYKIVNCYDSDIVKQLDDCNALLWHYHHANFTDSIMAKQLLFALEQSGKSVYPNSNTTWYFDDKIGQKYLLEAIDIPFVDTHVFYNKKEACSWIKTQDFPKVFKLRGGAGSINVKLLKSKREGLRYAKKAFAKGFKKYNGWIPFRDKFKKFTKGNESGLNVIKAFGRMLIPTEFMKYSPRERGYLYIQEFCAGNDSDIRVIVVGKRAFAIKRLVRENDFRASGSGHILYSKEEFDVRCIAMAFELNKKLKTQSLAIDFVFDSSDNPIIIEISYGWHVKGYDSCPGYWDNDLNWVEGKFDPYGWMIENLTKESSL